MDLVQIAIAPILNTKDGNEKLRNFQKNHTEFFDFSVVSVVPDQEYGYWMAVSYKIKEDEV